MCTKHALPDVGEYWQGEGGIYVGDISYDGGHTVKHLIFSAEDSPPGLGWGKTMALPTAAQSDIDGAANTQALVATGERFEAAKWADAYEKDGHTDFFLPSKGEWAFAAAMVPEKFSAETWYWTSTEHSDSNAWGEHFSGAETKHFYKFFDGNARAARTIAD